MINDSFNEIYIHQGWMANTGAAAYHRILKIAIGPLRPKRQINRNPQRKPQALVVLYTLEMFIMT